MIPVVEGTHHWDWQCANLPGEQQPFRQSPDLRVPSPSLAWLSVYIRVRINELLAARFQTNLIIGVPLQDLLPRNSMSIPPGTVEEKSALCT